jgi:hypothetical protein
MQVRRIDTTQRKDIRQFICFPFDLYRDCPQWVPPLISSMKLTLDRHRYPLYAHTDADFYVAESNGRILGRIAVSNNHLYNDYHQSKTAFFYYLEMVEDVQVSNALLDAACEWARKRGLQDIVGPKGPSRFDAHGILIDGFEHRPSVGVPYNFPYYDQLLKSAGFAKELDYVSGHATASDKLPERIVRIADKIKKRRGLWIKTFKSRKEMRSFAPQAHRIYLEAFIQVPGYYPVSKAEMQMTVDRITSLADPRMIKLVMKENQAIGFIISYPDVAAAIQKCGGRLWPFGWYLVMRERKRTKWVTLNGIGVLPEYQGMGANAVLYVELDRTLRQFGFEHGDYVQVAEVNLESMGDANAIGFPIYKTHRIYRKRLQGESDESILLPRQQDAQRRR